MLVSGGRSGWTWARSVAPLIGIASLLGMAACGGRTSALDPDVFATGGQGGSSGVKPGGNAGKAATGGGLLGTAGTRTSPPATSSGVDPALAKTPCERYCAGYGAQCRSRLEGKDCLATCQGELNGSGPFCQSLGIDTLTCLTPFFSAGGGDCGGAVSRALTTCGDLVANFDDCKNEFLAGNKNPVSVCERSLDDGSNPTCISLYSCTDGLYVTFCNPTESMQFSECACQSPNGALKSTRVPIAEDLCFGATALCQ